MSHRAATIETLPHDLREKVEDEVRNGDFTTPDEAIRQAILSQHERLQLRRSLHEAKEQIARGDLFTPEQSRARTHALAPPHRRQ